MGDGRQYRPQFNFICYFYCVIKRPLKRCELFSTTLRSQRIALKIPQAIGEYETYLSIAFSLRFGT